MQPSELVLNPRKLLNSFDQLNTSKNSYNDVKVGIEDINYTISVVKDCWICYDREKKDILIEPCQCKGDVSSVHHECLRKYKYDFV